MNVLDGICPDVPLLDFIGQENHWPRSASRKERLRITRELVASTIADIDLDPASDPLTPLAQHFTREMDRLWDRAELGMTQHSHRKLDRQRIRCVVGVDRQQKTLEEAQNII